MRRVKKRDCAWEGKRRNGMKRRGKKEIKEMSGKKGLKNYERKKKEK